MVARPDAPGSALLNQGSRIQMETLVVEHDIEEGAMHMETVIPAQPTFVIMGEPISDIYLRCPRKNRLPSATFQSSPDASPDLFRSPRGLLRDAPMRMSPQSLVRLSHRLADKCLD